MIFIDEIKTQLDIMLHPGKISREMTIRDAILYYYKIGLFPFILTIILELGLGYHNSVSQLGPTTIQLSTPLMIGIDVLSFLILAPAILLAVSGIFQFFGRVIFKKFTGSFNGVFTSVIYSTSVSLLFSWIEPIPLVKFLLIPISLWNFVVLIFSLSNLQKTSKLAALGVVIGTFCVILLIFVIIFFLILALGLLGAGLATS